MLFFVIKTPAVFDGLMWRIELMQGHNSGSQRILENFLHKLHIWQDQSSPSGSAYLIGDSHLQLIPQHATTWALNFAINGQPMSRIVRSVGALPGLKRAGTVFVNGGENDLSYGVSVEEIASYWKELFVQNPGVKKFVCIGLPETLGQRRDAEKVKLLNEKIAKICADNGAMFVSVTMGQGAFTGHKLAIDHVHLERNAMFTLAGLLEVIARNQTVRK